MEEKEIYHRGEVKLGLERMCRVMEAVGHPENAVPMIQLAGTNGKGSCGQLFRQVLTAAGLRVGHYQTPALTDPREIISVDGKNIAAEAFERLMLWLEARCRAAEPAVEPTKFEKDTAIAFAFFAEQHCDVVILEVGLGGDTDATNVTDATILSVITGIGMDHMEFLGNSLAEIAGHKAGIIKPGVPVVTGALPKEALAVVTAYAEKQQAPLCVAEEAETVERLADGSRRIVWENKNYSIGLPGKYQAKNAAVVLRGLEVLRETWEPVRSLPAEVWETAKEQGLQGEPLFGRFYRMGWEPELLLDGAHNVPAAQALREALDEFQDRPMIFMTAVFGDKEFRQVTKIVAGGAKEILVAKAPGKRGVPTKELAAMLEETWAVSAVPCKSISTMVADGIRRARHVWEETGVWPLLVGFGSLSWLTLARDAYEAIKNN